MAKNRVFIGTGRRKSSVAQVRMFPDKGSIKVNGVDVREYMPSEINVMDLNSIGDVRFGIAMRDGFFYLVDGDSKKTMELNSYGDLLSLFYNEDSETSRLLENSNRKDESVHREISYQSPNGISLVPGSF